MRRSVTMVFGFIVAVFIFTGCQEPTLDKDEVKLRKLSEYRLSDFNLAKSIQYFEIVKYSSSLKYLSKTIPSEVLLRYDKSKYRNLDNSIKKRIENFKLKHGKNGLHLYVKPTYVPSNPALAVACVVGVPIDPNSIFTLYNILRYVDHNGNIGTVRDRAELKSFLGKIDTPAEIQLFNSLSGKHEAYSYKKTGESYRLRLNYTIYYSSTKRSVPVKSFVTMRP